MCSFDSKPSYKFGQGMKGSCKLCKRGGDNCRRDSETLQETFLASKASENSLSFSLYRTWSTAVGKRHRVTSSIILSCHVIISRILYPCLSRISTSYILPYELNVSCFINSSYIIIILGPLDMSIILKRIDPSPKNS